MELIGKQQTGFIPGRSLSFNVVKTMEILSYLNEHNLPGVVALVDFEKCFDRISHRAIKGVFQYFGFGNYMISMIMLLFTDMRVCTINNGYTSEFLTKTRGINQGCNASPLIYTYTGEILNHLIMLNPNVKGVPMTELRNVLSQFADDTAAFLSFDRLTIENFANALECVEANMGLKVSYEKTTLYRVGSLQNSEAEFYTQQSMKWSSESLAN